MLSRLSRAALGLLLTPVVLLGQSPQARPTFDVASVRPSGTDQPRPVGRMQALPGGRFRATASVSDLIYYAYGLNTPDFFPAPFFRGGPGWITSDRYVIEAISSRNLEPDPAGELSPIRLMVQSLLADRFNLGIHWEKAQTDGFALVLARDDGRLGPKLRRSDLDCAAVWARYDAAGGDERASLAKERARCPPSSTMSGHTQLQGRRISDLAFNLAMGMRVAARDETGLDGTYDIDMQARPVVPLEQQADLDASNIDFGPPLEEALVQQLGLKLKRTQVTYDVIVVDRVDRPTEN